MICFAPCQTGLVSETNQGRGCVGHVFPTKAPVLFNLFLCLLAAFFNRYFGLFSLPNKCMCFIIIVIFAAMMDCRLIGLQPTEVYFSQFCRLRHPKSGCLHDLILMREPFWFSDCQLLIFTWQKAGKGILRSPFYKNTNPIHEGSTFMT